MWGFFPLYWKLLSSLPALEVLAHRMIWSFVFYFLIYILSSGLSLHHLLKQKSKDWLLLVIASILITLNWGIYIYAVNTGHILEGSLAYFINPIFNVAVGVLLFNERFPWALKLALLFAFFCRGLENILIARVSVDFYCSGFYFLHLRNYQEVIIDSCSHIITARRSDRFFSRVTASLLLSKRDCRSSATIIDFVVFSFRWHCYRTSTFDFCLCSLAGSL